MNDVVVGDVALDVGVEVGVAVELVSVDDDSVPAMDNTARLDFRLQLGRIVHDSYKESNELHSQLLVPLDQRQMFGDRSFHLADSRLDSPTRTKLQLCGRLPTVLLNSSDNSERKLSRSTCGSVCDDPFWSSKWRCAMYGTSGKPMAGDAYRTRRLCTN